MNKTQKDKNPKQHHPSHLSRPTPRPIPYKELVRLPAPRDSKDICHLFSLSPAVAGTPVKPCLNFPLASSILLIKEAKNPG